MPKIMKIGGEKIKEKCCAVFWPTMYIALFAIDTL